MLAELDTRLDRNADGGGQPAPRVAALHGLGGAGKTSVALEYAYRHLAEVGVAWQLAAEDAAVLAAGFAELASQLGIPADERDAVASVHGVLAASRAEWLLVFDNAPDRASVEAFLPSAGPGRVVITSQNQHWPPRWAMQVPALDAEVAAEFLIARTGDADQATAVELAEAVGVREATLTHHLNAMDARGLVTRTRDPANRRVQVVTMTAEGEAAFLRLREAAMSFDTQLKAGLSEADLETLGGLLGRLAANVGGATPDDGAPPWAGAAEIG